jgi:hypothetical protein
MSALNTAAQATLKSWHDMVAKKDLSTLVTLLHPEAVFRSPMAHTAYPGAAMVNVFLNTVLTVFSDFTYHREFASDDGSSVGLEFTAKVGEKSVKGIDLIRFDAEGKIIDFEVMVRPMSGLAALGEEMGRKMAPYLAASSPKKPAP